LMIDEKVGVLAEVPPDKLNCPWLNVAILSPFALQINQCLSQKLYDYDPADLTQHQGI
jgi:hypothetical protein